jgi:uncharacterized damage-inducible protein DinB
MATDHDPFKDTLRRYLQNSREALLWKVDGLPERELRLPRTPTGTNLLGLVKHMANVESGYFGETFGHPFPHPERIGEAPSGITQDPQADWFATEDESAGGIIELYREVWAFAEPTIAELPLDAPGRVPWWPDDSATVTLHQVLVHVLVDLSRHNGHADILRESIDGAVGMRSDSTNLPDRMDWDGYVRRLDGIAGRF